MKQMFTMMAAAALLAACSKDGDSAAGPKQIAIDPTIANPAVMPAAQRATRATDTDFEPGDAVGLTVRMTLTGEEYAANRKMTYDAAAKTFSAADFIWYEDENQPAALFAYYPWQEGAAAPGEFTVQADQSDEGYAKSDLVTAVKTNVYPTKSATAMTFRHKMTRILIDVTNESGHKVTGIVIKGAVATGVLDAQTGDFAAKAGAEPSDVKAHTATEDKLYYALLVPQKGVRLGVEVTTADGRVRSLTLGTTDLRSGENRRMPMNVQEKDLTVTFGGPITGWEDGEQLLPDGGSPTEATLEYGGVKYKIVTLKDGRTWMAENLRYVPEGIVVSTDPLDNDAKIWAPYISDGTTCTPVTDEAEVAKRGYLYSFETAFASKAEITPDNSASFEGVQGICPAGWHIPTQAEWIGLVGKTNKNEAGADLTDTSAPYFDAGYQGGKITLLNADGFNFTRAGVRMRSTISSTPSYQKTIYPNPGGDLSVNYVLSSTRYANAYSKDDNPKLTNIQFFALQTAILANLPEGKLSVGYLGYKSGVSVRCIKDAQ